MQYQESKTLQSSKITAPCFLRLEVRVPSGKWVKVPIFNSKGAAKSDFAYSVLHVRLGPWMTKNG